MNSIIDDFHLLRFYFTLTTLLVFLIIPLVAGISLLLSFVAGGLFMYINCCLSG